MCWGGVVPGSLILVGGDPGIGKSTLLLQASHALTEQQLKVLYISGEESVRQTKLRADRLKAVSPLLFVLSEGTQSVSKQPSMRWSRILSSLIRFRRCIIPR
ncbi:putative ATP-dependent serine protease [Paenibacillus sp. PvR052]|nr:putative ATP-dependent serine protease [Paenibacillus sp. PvP091]MBP1171092.1 putative ATP-dependent serine protease [Paenibacillus sp. PvR098]MBP2442120.1 putative ATP-dependent serine protease [Paenibacillus sp. PvP052]